MEVGHGPHGMESEGGPCRTIYGLEGILARFRIKNFNF
jgi:hypothetical protein